MFYSFKHSWKFVFDDIEDNGFINIKVMMGDNVADAHRSSPIDFWIIAEELLLRHA